MPLLVLLLFILIVPLIAVLLAPVTVIQRYRRGTARRPARGWVATLNVVTLTVSAVLFLSSAAVVDFWVPRAFPYAALGLLGGATLAFVGLRLTRWEPAPDSLHYTPNRWLVLTVTAVVAARMAYGFWRAWHAWQSQPADSWLLAAGIAGSLAAGGVVIGYYLSYWAGVRRRFRRHQRVTFVAR